MYYAHDHLYSPAALTNYIGLVQERYEYDAYGNPYVMDASYNSRASSLYDNPYYFQGKRLDLLEDADLPLMSWPYRDYSTYIGRWLQQEKLGMIPNDMQGDPSSTDAAQPGAILGYQFVENRVVVKAPVRFVNVFDVQKQYGDSINGYRAFGWNPASRLDRYGLQECDIQEYKESGFLGHRGLLVDSDSIDFGPHDRFPLNGVCPWGGYVSRTAKIWNLEPTNWGLLLFSFPPKPCCCATCSDIKTCVRRICKLYDWTVYTGWRNCWTFVVDAKASCCLKRQ